MIFAFLLTAFCWTAFAQELEIYPAKGMNIDLSSKKVLFQWKKAKGAKTYILDLYFRGPSKPTKSIRVKGTSYEVRFIKIPDRFSWTITPEGKKKLSEPQEVLTYQRPNTILRLNLSQVMSRVSVSSDAGGFAENLSGPMVDGSLEYFPLFLRREYSFVLSGRTSVQEKGNIEQKERKLGIEIGKILTSNKQVFQSIYLGYLIINRLEFVFTNATADYNVNFLGLRHLYQKRLSGRWTSELNTGLLLPFPYTFRPSIFLRPTLGFELSKHFRIDAFLSFENILSRPEEENSDDKVNIYQRTLGAGVGLLYRF